ncbi:hypothetical protein Tco_0757511, partial [Tanacetum coccineum]
FKHSAFLEGPEESLGGVEGPAKDIELVETPREATSRRKSLQFKHSAFLEGPEESLGGVEGPAKDIELVETPREATKNRQALLIKIASVREVVMGALLRVILKRLAFRSTPSNAGVFVPLVHQPHESFFIVPQTRSEVSELSSTKAREGSSGDENVQKNDTSLEELHNVAVINEGGAMMVPASVWGVEGVLPSIAADINVNTIHVDVGMGHSMSVKEDDGSSNNGVGLYYGEPSTTCPKVLGSFQPGTHGYIMNVAVNCCTGMSKPGSNASNSASIATGLVDRFPGLTHDDMSCTKPGQCCYIFCFYVQW